MYHLEITIYNSEEHDLSQIKDILKTSIYQSNDQKVDLALKFYTEFSKSYLFLAMLNTKIAGLLGCTVHEQLMQIQHLSVSPQYRKRGIGKYLIDHVASKKPCRDIVLETDHESVGFYKACGFTVEAIKGMRYKCLKTHP